MLTIKNLSYRYPNHHIENSPLALNNVSFHIGEGEWIAIVGHNGSGKSTLAKLLNGLLMAKEGDIIVDGLRLTEETIWAIRSKIGMVFQNPENQFVGSTVEDDVAFGLENQGVNQVEMRQRVKEALQLVGMWAFRDKEPSRLSGGQKQRVALASVLALRPKIIILDEATAMLDPKGRQMVMSVIKELRDKLNITILSITHDVEEASCADRVFVMDKGELLYQEVPRILFAKEDVMGELGLEQPFSERMKQELKQQGVNVPTEYMTMQELEEWLCQSILKK